MARHDQIDRPRRRRSAPLVEGPRWYKRRILTRGPLYGLVPMAIFGLVAILALGLGDGRPSGLIGLFVGTAAAPGLLVAGAPFGDESLYPLAVVASVPFWLLIGGVAGWRATRRPIATWADYARELACLSAAVAVGAGVALVIAAQVVGESLIV